MRFWKKTPKLFKNYYFLLGVFFIIWILFVDSNGLVFQIRLTQKRNELKSQKNYYIEKKKRVLKDREELLTNKTLLEKFAREKYLMKKPSEDLYIIITEN